jgi:hypothetical protein
LGEKQEGKRVSVKMLSFLKTRERFNDRTGFKQINEYKFGPNL